MNKYGSCELCDSVDQECGCFCECGLPHNQCVCDMTEKDWTDYCNQCEEAFIKSPLLPIKSTPNEMGDSIIKFSRLLKERQQNEEGIMEKLISYLDSHGFKLKEFFSEKEWSKDKLVVSIDGNEIEIFEYPPRHDDNTNTIILNESDLPLFLIITLIETLEILWNKVEE